MWNYIHGVKEPIKKKAKTNEELLQTRRLYEKEKRSRHFQDEWKKTWKWLAYDENKKSMTCTICQRYDTEGPFATGGSENFKKQGIEKHDKSDGHKKNVLRYKAETAPVSTTTGSKTLTMLNKAAINKLRILFSNAHYVAKLGRPYTDYVQLAKLDKSKDLEIGGTYLTDKYCQVFIKAIADTHRVEQDEFFKESPFISVISDGSTDTSSKEAEIVFVRSSANGKVKTYFMGLRNVQKADSEHIKSAIVSLMNERCGEIWKQKIVAMGTDGASVMLGRSTGVVQKVREHTERPFLFAIHCSAHRLELAYKDAIKCLETKVHQKAEALLLNLYLFYKYSPLNRSNLKASFCSLGLKPVVPTRVGGTRWLPHTRKALDHLLTGKDAIIQHLEQIQNPCDESHRKDSAAKARNFLKLLKDKSVIVWLHYLMDVVTCLSKISESIQERNATLADIWNELESARVILSKYIHSPGPYLCKIETTGLLETSRKNLLKQLITSINKRFEGDIHLFKGSSFISFRNWPEQLTDDLADFGDIDVSELVQVCAEPLKQAGCKLELVESEWIRLKHEIYNSKKTVIRSLAWDTMWGSISEKYSNILMLISLLLTLPSSSVDAERGFSKMKIQKSDWRSSLGDRHLSDLLLISAEGAEIGKFNPDNAIALWEADSVRTRRPFFNDNEKPKKCDTEIVDEEDLPLGGDDVYLEAEKLVNSRYMMTDDDDYDEDDLNINDIQLLQNKAYKLLMTLI